MLSCGPWSLWQREVEAQLQAWPELPADARLARRHLIIGGGLAGLACAAALTRAGHRPLLVDANGPATGASGRNAGFVLLGNASEWPAMVERFGRDACRQLLAVARRNHAIISERWAGACEHEASGSLMLSMDDDEHEIQTLRHAAQLLREDGVELRMGQAPAYLRGFAEALEIPEDGQVHPARLALAIAAEVEDKVRAEIVELDFEAAGRGGQARTAGGARIDFDQVVLATNAWTHRLLPPEVAPIVPARGQVIATAPLEERVLHPVAYAGWGYDYFRQRADGRVILGGRRHLFAEAEASDEAETSESVQASLEAYLARHLPFAAAAPITHRWAGIMGFSPDELPIVDQLPGHEGRAFCLAGFTGHGLGLTIACAQLLVDAWLSGPDARSASDATARAQLALFSALRPSLRA